MKDIIERFQRFKDRLSFLQSMDDRDEIKKRMIALEAQMNEPRFWQDHEKARVIASEHDEIIKDMNGWNRIESEISEGIEMATLLSDDDDEGSRMELEKKIRSVEKQILKLELSLLFRGEYDDRHAIVAIHAGAGGVDAQDWTNMLARMLFRYCERQGLRTKILEESRGSEAGLKRIVFEVSGRHGYGLLRSEHGVHRLVRVSPFDAEQMRHTSFALVEVVPDLGGVEEFSISPEDLKIDTFRASGHGGQGVNTTDSAVRITHLPTGIVVTCQNERSQAQNKATAMRYLRGKLFHYAQAKKEEERMKIRGELSSAEWGSQIRSYVLHPYKLVKDHRTDCESPNPDEVLDGDLLSFVEAFLRKKT